MDPIIKLFSRKTPAILLDKYRRHTHEVLSVIFKTLAGAIFNLPDSNAQWSEDSVIVTGSVAEGASLARLFSHDSDTSGEFEADVMCSFWTIQIEEQLLDYIHNNKVFAHVKVDSSTWMQVISILGDDVIQNQSLLSWKEDGLYLNSDYVVTWFKQRMEDMPDFLNNVGFRPSVAVKDCQAGSASIAISMTDVFDKAEINEVYANANEQFFGHIQLTRQYYEKWDTDVREMLQRLQILQDEFMDMRSEKVPASLQNHVVKATVWAVTAMDIADLIFDFRKNSACKYLHECLGLQLTDVNEGFRNQLKGQIQNYVDQLDITEEDINDPSVAARISGTLRDIECYTSQLSCQLRLYKEQNSTYFKCLNFASQNPQMNNTPQSLQEFSRFLKRTSIDLVPCTKLMFWPSVAMEWKTRDRVWPDQSVIDQIVSKGAHLVGKAFCHSDIDWRLSFSVAEIDLATRWSPIQHFVYFIFKSVFYKFIKPLSSCNDAADVSRTVSNKKYLASYTAKTVMMWTSESVDESWWREHNAAQCLTVLLLVLQSAFEWRKLDHYFVPSVNLLDGLPDEVASLAVGTIRSILDDTAAIVDQLECHFVNIDVFFNAMPEQAQLAKAIQQFFCYTLTSYRILPVLHWLYFTSYYGCFQPFRKVRVPCIYLLQYIPGDNHVIAKYYLCSVLPLPCCGSTLCNVKVIK